MKHFVCNSNFMLDSIYEQWFKINILGCWSQDLDTVAIVKVTTMPDMNHTLTKPNQKCHANVYQC